MHCQVQHVPLSPSRDLRREEVQDILPNIRGIFPSIGVKRALYRFVRDVVCEALALASSSNHLQAVQINMPPFPAVQQVLPADLARPVEAVANLMQTILVRQAPIPTPALEEASFKYIAARN